MTKSTSSSVSGQWSMTAIPSRWWLVWRASVRYQVPQWWAVGALKAWQGLTSRVCLLAIWPGRHGGSTDPAEEVDHVLEGPVGVLSPGLESLLQPASGGAHPAGRLLAQHHLLRGFSSAMVSGCGVAGGREEQVVRSGSDGVWV